MRIAPIAAAIVLISSAPAFAQAGTCRDLANAIVQQATKDVLKVALKDNPALRKLDGEELAKLAGKQFLTADRPDFKAYGYMLLLWYGGKEGREMVTGIVEKLATPEDRAHFYFVMGLFQLRAKDPKLASQGRDYIRQMRDSGKVTFVTDTMWDQLIKQCRLPS